MGGFGAATGARAGPPWAGAASPGRTEHYQDWKGWGPRAPSSRPPSAPTGLRHRTALPTANSEKTGSVARDTYVPRPGPAPSRPLPSRGRGTPLPSWRRVRGPPFPRAPLPWRSWSSARAIPRSPFSPPQLERSLSQGSRGRRPRARARSDAPGCLSPRSALRWQHASSDSETGSAPRDPVVIPSSQRSAPASSTLKRLETAHQLHVAGSFIHSKKGAVEGNAIIAGVS